MKLKTMLFYRNPSFGKVCESKYLAYQNTAHCYQLGLETWITRTGVKCLCI